MGWGKEGKIDLIDGVCPCCLKRRVGGEGRMSVFVIYWIIIIVRNISTHLVMRIYMGPPLTPAPGDNSERVKSTCTNLPLPVLLHLPLICMIKPK